MLKAMIRENNGISFSGLHLNVRSLNKNFENLRNLLVEINFCFKVICITEILVIDDLHTNNRYQLPNYARPKEYNTLVSGNTGDKKNLHPGGRKYIFSINLIELFK